MTRSVVGPVLQHLRSIGLDHGSIHLATAFYSGRALAALDIGADSVTVMCRLDLDSIEEWVAGFIAPEALLTFMQAQQRRGAEVRLFAAPTAHAKLYVGYRAALIGSANLTMQGFGGGHEIVSRVDDKGVLRDIARALREYRSLLKEVELGRLVEYVEGNRAAVRQRRPRSARHKPDQLPAATRSLRPHLGSYAGFLAWLRAQQPAGAAEIWERAHGKGNLSGHIDRNFHGLRQFFIAFPEAWDLMRGADPDSYKLSRDALMERRLSEFVQNSAVDEDEFVLEFWKTYLPVECGGRAGRHGGTIGNLNYMLPLVARYLTSTMQRSVRQGRSMRG